jgi:hypothetical protein
MVIYDLFLSVETLKYSQSVLHMMSIKMTSLAGGKTRTMPTSRVDTFAQHRPSLSNNQLIIPKAFGSPRSPKSNKK